MYRATNFNGEPLKVVVVESDKTEDGSDSFNLSVRSVVEDFPNIDSVFVDSNKLTRSINAIPKNAGIIFVPCLRNSKKGGCEIVREIRTKRNGVFIVAWDDNLSISEIECFYEADADFVFEKNQILNIKELDYLLFMALRRAKKKN